MSETESVLHSHSTMIRLLEEIQVHASLLADPWLDHRESKAVLDELLGFAQSFHRELHEHIEEEEEEIFPALKRRLQKKQELSPVQDLYVEHRALEAALGRVMYEVERALATGEGGARYASQIVRSVQELSELFEAHSHNERAVFTLAGVQ